MTTKEEALKLALEALHKGKVACEWGQAHDHVQQIVQAMDAIREALAEQPNNKECESELASQPLYEGITQNTQYHYSKFHSWFDSELHRQKYTKDHPAYLAAQEAWNAANDAAQHRINRLNAEIEAWKVRFKIAEDALAKLNGPEQEPVEYWTVADGWVSEQAEVPAFVWVEPDFWEHCKRVNCGTAYRLPAPGRQPLYTSPPASKPWVGLTDEEMRELEKQFNAERVRTSDEEYLIIYPSAYWAWQRAIEAKLREKNA